MNEAKSIEVLALGTRVRFGGNVGMIYEGTVRGIAIYPGETKYKIRWWDGAMRKEEWLDFDELGVCDRLSKIVPIGFINLTTDHFAP